MAAGSGSVGSPPSRRKRHVRLPKGTVSVDRAARLLGVSNQTVRRWCNQHERKSPGQPGLPSTRLANHYRVIAITDLRAFRSQLDATHHARQQGMRSIRSERDLHYLPQIITELQATVGQAIAEYMSDTTLMSNEAATSIEDLKARSKTLERRARILLKDLEQYDQLKPTMDTIGEQLSLISARMGELVAVKEKAGV
jgi:transposase-like protein